MKWIKEKSEADNGVAVMQNLIQQLNVKVTKQTTEKVLKDNPDYPSLASLSDALNEWKVENLAVRLAPSDLSEVNFPVIAHLQPPPPQAPSIEEQAAAAQAGASCGSQQQEEEQPNPRFVLVKDINEQQAVYLDTEKGWQREPKAEFFKKWSGIMLLAATNAQSGDVDYHKRRKEERLSQAKIPSLFASIGILLLTLIASGIVLKPAVLSWLPLFLLKIAGVVLSTLLLIQLVDKENTIVNKVCGLGQGGGEEEGESKSSGCGEGVLDSPAAKLFGWLSMSEVGAFYFLGGLLAIAFALFTNAFEQILGALAVFNVIALPYTVFSIYYQARKAKKWCTLCVGVQVVLWLEFAALLPTLTAGFQGVDFQTLTIIGWAFLLPIIAWMTFKPGLGKDRKVKELQKQLLEYKRNPALIKAELKDGREVPVGVMPQEVVLGNLEAENTLIIFSNPFCNPCAEAHKEVDKLIANIGDELRVLVRFNNQGSIGDIDTILEQMKEGYAKEEDEDRKKQFEDFYGKTPSEWHKKLEQQKVEGRKRNTIALNILAMAKLGDQHLMHKAMSDWYNREDKSDQAIEDWKKKFPINEALANQMQPALEASGTWATQAMLMGTPTFILNDREFDNALDYLDNLKYYFRALEEEEALEAAERTQQEALAELPAIHS